jgi:signal transduction histidine kinase
MQPGRRASDLRGRELHALLKSQLESVPEVAVLHVTNAMGDHTYSSLDPVPKINVADRYHFTRNRDDPAAGLVVSPPIVSRTTGQWTVVLARRLNFEDGRFAGIIQVVLNLKYFQQFYRSLDLGPSGLVALYDQELRLAARYPPSEKDMGKVSHLHARAYLDKGIKHASYRAKSSLDGVNRLYSFRLVDDLPLLVFAGIAEDDYLAEWRRHVWQYGIGAMVFSLVVLGFGLRQRRAEMTIRQLNAELEQRVAARTAQLEAANRELEAFTYSISHNLRAPLRHIDGFIGLLNERTATRLDDESRRYMTTISRAAGDMDALIDDLLSFSQMGRFEMAKARVDLGVLLREVIQELEPEARGRTIDWRIAKLPPVTGDRFMLRIVLLNLISNALKFTQPCPQAEIEIGCQSEPETEIIVSVRDNGVGFDMRYAGKLFGVFERLHGVDEFEGNGIGLAIVKRVVGLHGGRVWAEGRLDQGASFFFTLPQSSSSRTEEL